MMGPLHTWRGYDRCVPSAVELRVDGGHYYNKATTYLACGIIGVC